MAIENTAWQLAELVDSLAVELDKSRETVAVKAINKQLCYTVKDLALDLNIFPSYDGDQVRFVTAQPGQSGASKVTIHLGSITDQQVRATSKVPGVRSDVDIEDIGVDKQTRKQLKKLGVNSVSDLHEIEKKNVDLGKVSEDIDYRDLANRIQKNKRNQNPPLVTSVSLTRDEQQAPCLVVKGERLAVNPTFRPVAVVNQLLADVTAHSDSALTIRLTRDHRLGVNNEVILTFDPFAVMKVNVKS